MTSNVQQLKVSKNAQYINQVVEEFREKDPIIDGPDQIRNFQFLSFIPSAISVLTAAFLVYYFVSDYPLTVAVLLGLLGVVVLAGNEAAKRYLLSKSFKSALIAGKVGFGLIFALLIIHAISGSSSYFGGSKIVTENSIAPTLLPNPLIAAKKAELDDVKKSIKDQQGTTWKGRITVDANRNLKTLYPIEASLIAQISALEAEDYEKQKAIDIEHTAKITNLGILTGSISLICDAVLFFMLLHIARLKNNIRILASSPTPPSNGRKSLKTGANQQYGEMPGASERQMYVVNADSGLNLGDNDFSDEDIREIIKLAKKGANANKHAFKKRNTENGQKSAQHFESLEVRLGNILQASA